MVCDARKKIKRSRAREPESLFSVALGHCQKRETEAGAFYFVIEGPVLFVFHLEGKKALLLDVFTFAKSQCLEHVQFVTYREPLIKMVGKASEALKAKMQVVGWVIRVDI